MKEPTEAKWAALSELELAPLLPWRDSYSIMCRMQELLESAVEPQRLIEAFAGTRSATYAAGVCWTIAIYSDRVEAEVGISVLLTLFSHLRLKHHFAAMDMLVTKISYLIQRGHLQPVEQETLVQLGLACLEMCEAMPPEEWVSGRLDDVIDRMALIVNYGLTEATRATTEAVLLQKLLDRTRTIQRLIGRKGHPDAAS